MAYTVKGDPHPKSYNTLIGASLKAAELLASQGHEVEIYEDDHRFPMAIERCTKRQRDDLRHMFQISPGILAPIPSLVSLRDTVLGISHTRLPKWRFRFAPDLVVQLQPRPAERRDQYALFDGLVIEGPDITKEHFSSWKVRAGLPLTAIGFHIRDITATYYASKGEPGQWVVAWTSWNVRSLETMGSLKDRLVAELPRLRDLDTRFMFQACCLVCGKALTDPVSMARWIGPECAHHFGIQTTLDVKQLNLI
jgi:hypothetical protein